ncbi:fimbrial biogenesis chaperone [Escherichia coli]
MKLKKLIMLISFIYSSLALSQSDGVNLAATRIILDSQSEHASLKIHNNSKDKPWLLRAWVSVYDNDEKTNKFIITPPLYRIQPLESYQLRINKVIDSFPKDKESIYRVNVLSIPPKAANKNNSGKTIAALDFAVNNRIKLIYRPHELNNPDKVANAFKLLKFSNTVNDITINNPTPYYITMDNVKVNRQQVTSIDDFVVAPYSKLTIPVKNAKTLSFTTINDYGGKTPTTDIKF